MKSLSKLAILASTFATSSCAFLSGGNSNVSKLSNEEISEVTSIMESISESTVSESTNSSSTSSEFVSSEESISEISESVVNPDIVSESNALKALKSSPFKEFMSTETPLGLSEMHNVGVDEDEFEYATLYEVPAEGTIYYVGDYDITPNGADNALHLKELISSIKSVSGTKIIKFDEDTTYKFKGAVEFSDVSDLYFVGKNTYWVYSAWCSYFSAANSKNIHLNGINFDMNPSPTISGTIKSYSFDGSGNLDVVLSIFDEFDLTNRLYSEWDADSPTNYTGSYMECSVDPITGNYTPDLGKNLIYNTTSSNRNNRGMLDMKINSADHEITVKLAKSFPWHPTGRLITPTVNDRVSLAFTMYNKFGFSFINCEDIYLEHVITHVTAGMGFRVNGGKNFYLNHVHFAQDANSKRIMTCTADIIHTISLENDLIMTNCLFEGSHDDALNIKTYYGNVSSVVKSTKELTLSQTQNEVATKFEVGDVIDVYDKNNFRLVDRFTIVESTVRGSNYDIVVDHRPSDIEEGFVVGNDTRTTRMKLMNSIIRNKRNRGILFQTRYSEISNCCFSNVIMGAVQVLAVGDDFAEAIVPTDIVIKNNKFLNCAGGDIGIFTYGKTGQSSAGTIHDVNVYNNYIFNANGSPFRIQGCKNCNLENNLIHYARNLSSFNVCNVYTSSDCDIKNNVLKVDGTSSRITFVNLASDATNINDVNNEIK